MLWRNYAVSESFRKPVVDANRYGKIFAVSLLSRILETDWKVRNYGEPRYHGCRYDSIWQSDWWKSIIWVVPRRIFVPGIFNSWVFFISFYTIGNFRISYDIKTLREDAHSREKQINRLIQKQRTSKSKERTRKDEQNQNCRHYNQRKCGT